MPGAARIEPCGVEWGRKNPDMGAVQSRIIEVQPGQKNYAVWLLALPTPR
jgi:hypothetical protein